ncbi:hypothetical protein MMC12_005292 [Toensbergia leucococca]|nr:hypothetical protein [Toensbergia leucococca]
MATNPTHRHSQVVIDPFATHETDEVMEEISSFIATRAINSIGAMDHALPTLMRQGLDSDLIAQMGAIGSVANFHITQGLTTATNTVTMTLTITAELAASPPPPVPTSSIRLTLPQATGPATTPSVAASVPPAPAHVAPTSLSPAAAAAASASAVVSDDQCPICYEKFGSENVIELGCKHEFCAPCIETWFTNQMLSEQAMTCPCCRGCCCHDCWGADKWVLVGEGENGTA